MLTLAADQTFWELINASIDATIYFWVGAIATGLMILRIVLMFIFGMDDAMDFDVSEGVDVGHEGFGLFSVFSILAFLMGAGWMGLVSRLEWGLGAMASAMLAATFGTVMLLLAAGMMLYIRRLHQSGTYKIDDAIGKIGKVYLTIPPNAEGAGEVQITVSGRQKNLPAKTRHDRKLESFTTVKVLEVEGNQTLIVEPH